MKAYNVFLWLAGSLFGVSNGKWSRRELRPTGLLISFALLGLWALFAYMDNQP